MNGNLVIAHGGGPTAVINASLYGVIREAEKYDSIKGIYAARYGIQGVLKEDFIDLAKESSKNIELLPYTPSSAIGSCRRKLFENDYLKLINIFKKHNISKTQLYGFKTIRTFSPDCKISQKPSLEFLNYKHYKEKRLRLLA